MKYAASIVCTICGWTLFGLAILNLTIMLVFGLMAIYLFPLTFPLTPVTAIGLLITPFLLMLAGIGFIHTGRVMRLPYAHFGRCRFCDYDLRGHPIAPGVKCPECGAEV